MKEGKSQKRQPDTRGKELKEWACKPANGLVRWTSIGASEAGFKYTEKDAKK